MPALSPIVFLIGVLGSPTQIGKNGKKVGSLILRSLLEDLVVSLAPYL